MQKKVDCLALSIDNFLQKGRHYRNESFASKSRNGLVLPKWTLSNVPSMWRVQTSSDCIHARSGTQLLVLIPKLRYLQKNIDPITFQTVQF